MKNLILPTLNKGLSKTLNGVDITNSKPDNSLIRVSEGLDTYYIDTKANNCTCGDYWLNRFNTCRHLEGLEL